MPETFKDIEITRSGYSEDGRGWHKTYISQGVDNTTLLIDSLKKIIPVRESHPTLGEYWGFENAENEKLDGKAFNFRVKQRDDLSFIICDFELSGELLENYKADKYPNISTGFQFESTNQQGQRIGHSVNHVGLFGNTGVADTDLNKSARIEKSNFYITEFNNMENGLTKKQQKELDAMIKKEVKALGSDASDGQKTQIEDYLKKVTSDVLPNVISKSLEIVNKAKEEEDDEDDDEDRFKSIQKTLDSIDKRVGALESSNKAKDDDEDDDKNKSGNNDKGDDSDDDKNKSLKVEIDSVFKQLVHDGAVTSDQSDHFEFLVNNKGLAYAKQHFNINSNKSKNPNQFKEVLGTLENKIDGLADDSEKIEMYKNAGLTTDQAKNAIDALKTANEKGLVKV